MRSRLVVLVLLALALVSCGSSGGDSTVPAATGTDGTVAAEGISVTGTGEVLGVPDTMTLTIGVQVTRETVSDANEVAASRADAVIDSLTDAGVDDEDIQTTNYSIYPEYDYTDRGRELVGFTVSNSVVAKIRSVDSGGEIIDAAVRAGGDDIVVQGVGFSVEDDLERLEAARARAWSDAEAKARQLADLAGVELGAAVRITEIVEGGTLDVRSGADFAAEEAPVTPIEAGQVASTVQLTVVFAISG